MLRRSKETNTGAASDPSPKPAWNSDIQGATSPAHTHVSAGCVSRFGTTDVKPQNAAGLTHTPP